MHTQQFYIQDLTDSTMHFSLHLRFSDKTVNSVLPDRVVTDEKGTLIEWTVRKNDIFLHGLFELQIEGHNSSGIVFQTKPILMLAEESLNVEDKAYANPNSENLRLREEAFELLEKAEQLADKIEAETGAGADVYTSAEVDGKLEKIEKKLKDYYYTFDEVDWALDEKADADTVYTKSEVDALIANNVGTTQLTPTFAGSVQECTDTSKLYVLPDGYIYAYMTVNGAAYTNQIPISTDADGAVYNGIGYKSNLRINSSGAETEVTDNNYNWYETGFIPAKMGDSTSVFRTNAAYPYQYNSVLAWYDSSKRFLGYSNGSNLSSYFEVTKEDGIMTIDARNLKSTAYNLPSAAYVRFGAPLIDNSTVFTVNEEIKTGTVTKWTNTGHAFVTVDYEDRIIALESKLGELTSSDSSNANPFDTEGYVVKEAARTAVAVENARTDHSLVFAMVSDVHYGMNSETATGTRHTGDALNIIHSITPFDAFCMLGDYTTGSASTTKEQAFQHFAAVNSAFSGMTDIPNVRLNGNHDCLPYNYDGQVSEKEQFGYIGRFSTNVQSTKNYGYIDFASQKVRVIYLNTCDVGDVAIRSQSTCTAVHISAEQLQWFADILNETGQKSDWSIILMSHTPLDFESADYSYTDANGKAWSFGAVNALHLVTAYENGQSGSLYQDGEEVSFDFSNHSAKMICQFHGHLHNFLTGTLGNSGVKRLAVPNVCNGRENQYDRMQEEESYPKLASSARDTSFCVCVIDLNSQKITAVHYGAGIDRETQY